MRSIGFVPVAGAAAALVLLASCSITALGIEHFDREQTAADTVDRDALRELSIIDPDSTRHLVDDAGTQFFAAQRSSSESVCLVMIPDSDDGASAACSVSEPVTVKDGNTEYSLTRMADADAGWEEIAPYLWKYSRLAS